MAKSRHQNGYLTVSSKLKVKDATSLFDFLFKVLLIIKYILLVQNKQITLMDIPLLIQYKSDDYTTPSISTTVSLTASLSALSLISVTEPSVKQCGTLWYWYWELCSHSMIYIVLHRWDQCHMRVICLFCTQHTHIFYDYTQHFDTHTHIPKMLYTLTAHVPTSSDLKFTSLRKN